MIRQFSPNRTARLRSGFTLLEVLLATLIFSMIMLSIFSLMGTSVRSLERTTRRVDAMQRARGTFDLLSRDFGSAFFKNEDDYNNNARNTLENLLARNDTENEGEGEDARGREASARGASRRDERRGEGSEQYLLPIEIDLAMVGSDSGELDEISMAVYQPNEPGGFYMPWGMKRVQYFVREGVLYRAEDTIFKEHVDATGAILAKAEPELEVICDNVVMFDLKYRYWHEGEWLLAPDWDSSAKRYRFPEILGEPEDYGMTPEEFELMREQESPDDAPAMIEVTIAFEDPARPGVATPYRKSFRVFQSQETAFTPLYSDQRRGSRASAPSERLSSRDRDRGRGLSSGAGGRQTIPAASSSGGRGGRR